MRLAPITVLLSAALLFSSVAHAVVPVRFGNSWDGPCCNLQSIVDARYGPGVVDVTTDYLGAADGDPDPWFWVADRINALLIREVAGNSNRNTVGWYLEEFSYPIIDGFGDGIMFDGRDVAGDSIIVQFDAPTSRFGFWLDPNGPNGAVNAPQPERFFTNRHYNDPGPDGTRVLHQPYGGDVQALVFDLTALRGVPTWLVCFEDTDSGAMPGDPGQSLTDNDFNDVVFEITALGATPARPMTFGSLKLLYR